MQAFFPNLEIWHVTLPLAIVAGVYTAFGGLKAVVITDAIQAIILIVGCSVLTWMLYAKLDFSWANVVANVPEGHFSVVRPIDDKALPWPGLILGVPFLGFWYWSTNQYIIQRVLGARDIRQARWGVMLAGFLKIVPLFIMVIPGAMAISILPGLENGDAVFPRAVIEILPVGMVGIVLAGLLSAIMSSVDSTLNSASTLLVVDFIKPNNPDIADSQLARYGRITTLTLMVIAALWAPMIANFQGLWDYLQEMFSIIVPPVVVLFLVGVFYKRGNGHGAFWTLVTGTLLGVLLFLAGKFEISDIHYTIRVGIMVGVSTLVFIIVSAMTEAPNQEEIEPYIFRRELLSDGMEGVPWYLDYRFHALLLVLMMGYVLFVFW